MWTVLTWVLIPYLAIKYGVNGAAIGYSLVGASSVVAIFIAKKYVNFSITDSMVKPLLGALVMGAVLLVLRKSLPVNIYAMEMLTVVGLAVYAGSMLSMMGISLLEDAKASFKTIFSKRQK